jgi:hypothetical protein
MNNTIKEQFIIKMLNDFNSAVNEAASNGKNLVKEVGGFSTLEEIRKLNLLVERRERRESRG